MTKSATRAAGVALMAIGVLVLAFSFVPTTLGVTGPGNCRFGPVETVVTSSSSYQMGEYGSASGTVGGNCDAAGDAVYWSIIPVSGGSQVADGAGTVSSGNVFTFTFMAPSTGSYYLWASLCASFLSCSTPGIAGTAQAYFSTTSSAAPTYTTSWRFSDSNGNRVDATVYLYSAGSLVGSGVTDLGSVAFPAVPAGTYSVSYFPTSGAYAPGSQGGFTVSSTGSNQFSIVLPVETVTQTTTSSATVTGTIVSSSGTFTVTTTSTASVTPSSQLSSATNLEGAAAGLVLFLVGFFVYRRKA